MMPKTWKMTETREHGYSSESTHKYLPACLENLFFLKGLSGKCVLVCTYLNGQADFLNTTHFSFLKGISGKYVLVCTYLNGQADFLNTTHSVIMKMAQILRYMLTMQLNLKENGFQMIQSMIHSICRSHKCYNSFRASQNYVGQVKNHLSGMVS